MVATLIDYIGIVNDTTRKRVADRAARSQPRVVSSDAALAVIKRQSYEPGTRPRLERRHDTTAVGLAD